MAVGTPTRRLEMIEGRKVARTPNNRPPLQPSLDRLLSAVYMVTRREDIRPAGTRVQCEVERTHRFGVLREGRHVGLDAVVRDIRVEMCRDCGAVCVRDVSYDRLTGLPVGRRGAQRRDAVIGWYSGKRLDGREYR